MTRAEIERFSGACHQMQRYLQSIPNGELWFLTTAKGTSGETIGEIRDAIGKIQKRIGVLQHEHNFFAYSAWCFETRPQTHVHIIFVGDDAVVERLNRSAFGASITIKPVHNLPRLLQGYLAKERTPQAGYGRKHQLGGRIKGSHKLDGGGDRVRLSRELERDAIEAGLVGARPHKNAKRKAKDERKGYRLRNTGPLARAPRDVGQILLFPELSKPVARWREFGGGICPRPVAIQLEFKREQLGLSQREFAGLVGITQGTYSNAIRGHDPLSSAVVNRLRDVLSRQSNQHGSLPRLVGAVGN